MRKLYRPFLKEYDLIEQHMNMMSGLSLAASAIETPLSANNFGSRKLSAVISAQGYNYDVEDHSQISMHIANLVHSRDYISDPMSLIITMCGELVIS